MTTIEEKIQEVAIGKKTIQAEKEANTFTLNKEDSELLKNIWKNNSRWKGVSARTPLKKFSNFVVLYQYLILTPRMVLKNFGNYSNLRNILLHWEP